MNRWITWADPAIVNIFDAVDIDTMKMKEL